MQVQFLANLTRHQKAVNAVRFSPTGTPWPNDLLAFFTTRFLHALVLANDLQGNTWRQRATVRRSLIRVGTLAECRMRVFPSPDGTVLIWQFGGEGATPPAFGEESEITNKESWNVVRLLRSVL